MAKYGTSKYSRLKYGGINFIFDRTDNDLKEKTPYAYYNFGDLNRIESNIEMISELLNNQYYIQDVQTKTDWSVTDFPSHAQLERIRINLLTLYKMLAVRAQSPPVPESFSKMDIYMANDIEKILYDIYLSMQEMSEWRVSCGALICGQGGVIL